jgi:hypothetical protein
MTKYVLPAKVAGPVVIPPGNTQPGIPINRKNPGKAGPTLVITDAGGFTTGAAITATWGEDTKPDVIMLRINVGETVPTGSYVVLLTHGTEAMAGIAVTVPGLVSEEDVVGDLGSLPALVAYAS